MTTGRARIYLARLWTRAHARADQTSGGEHGANAVRPNAGSPEHESAAVNRTGGKAREFLPHPSPASGPIDYDLNDATAIPIWEEPVEVVGICDGCGANTRVRLGVDKWLCAGCMLNAIKVGMYP